MPGQVLAVIETFAPTVLIFQALSFPLDGLPICQQPQFCGSHGQIRTIKDHAVLLRQVDVSKVVN